MTTVHVDIVEPGRARVTAPNGRGYIARDGRSYYATIDECDTDDSVVDTTREGLRTYKSAAQWLSRALGYPDAIIEVQKEKR